MVSGAFQPHDLHEIRQAEGPAHVHGAGATVPANAFSRNPGGHPEGYFKGKSAVYRVVAALIGSGGQVTDTQFPTVSDGLAGIDFVRACIESSRSNSACVALNAGN